MLNAPRHRAVPRSLLAGAAVVAACGLAVSGPGLTFAAAAAASTTIAQQPGDAAGVSVAITSVSPGYAEPGKTVTVSGTLTNTSSAPASGLSVQLLSSGLPFGSRSQLQNYANVSLSPVSGAAANLSRTLAPHSIMNWSVPLNPASVPIPDTFGVYPLAAEAEDASFNSVSVSRTFLPFWPNNRALDPSVQQISWIWPLIDQPHQAGCPAGLLDNSLASSLASGGRLSGLLDAGQTYATSAHLTWAIDPAVLVSAQAMTTPYQVSSAGCRGPVHPADPAAAAWLAQLKTATFGQPMFVTPYDDADIAALVHNNMNADLTEAYGQGRTVAEKALGRNFNVTTASAGSALNGTAWPADGIANYADLENLAASDDINTVVLGSSVMPPSPQQTYTPSALTTTPDGVGPPLNVLVSDDTITQILGGADSSSASAATAFSVRQRYLAETAMITAERPNLARSIVVAPPRRWDPPANLAAGLLSETVGAPWLRTVSLSQLASAKHPTGQASRQNPTTTSTNALTGTELDQARQIDQQVSTLESLQDSPNPAYKNSLYNAEAAVESSAWRGGGPAAAQGSALAQHAGAYLSAQENKVTIIGAPRVTLGGLSGSVPVSVSNQLDFPVRVRLEATGPSGRVTIRQPRRTITVPALQQEIVKFQVAAATVGSTTVAIALVTPQGTPLSSRQASIIVQATHYGDLALIIIIAALAVFLLTAAARAFRRRPGARRGAGAPPETPDGPADAAAAPDTDRQLSGDTGPDQRGLPDEAAGPGNFVSGGPASGQITAQTRDHDRPEATDDYAWAPGQAERR